MIELDSVSMETNERAARVEVRCNYRVVGYLMQHNALAKRAIVDGGSVRWFPNDDEFQKMMHWKRVSDGPGQQPPEWGVDDSTPAVKVVAAPAAPAAPARPVLAAAPSAKLLESTEAALGELARELGCAFNDTIPHNAGWFVPGKPTAHASAYDAIRALFAALEGGGTVYRAPPAPEPVKEPPAKPARAAAPEINQGDLF